jgi:hypothetical protein
MNNDLELLRSEVKKRRAAVTGKIARMRRTMGVDIAGTREDPRRPPSAVKGYNKPQLIKYLGQLEAFQSRDVGYVPGSREALPKKEWLEYKKFEKAYNTLGKAFEDKIADIKVPGLGVNIKQRSAMIHPTAQGDVVNRPFVHIDRSSKNIKDRESLKKLTVDMKRKLSKDFIPGEIKKSRKQLNDMLKTIGNSEYGARAKALTDTQFNILWNYTHFATNISLQYEISKLQAAGSEDRWYSSVIEDKSDELRELFDAAASFPSDEAELGTKKEKPQRRQKG